jgi:hypothetical protein
MRFYMLVSYNANAFEKSLRCLPLNKTQVVINSLDKEIEEDLASICDHYEVPYVITESDGTPATGKNAMIKVFLESDDEYGVFIDGGDVITPYGIRYYEHLTYTFPKPPDVLVIYKQVQVYGIDTKLLHEGMTADQYPEDWVAHYPYDKTGDSGEGNVYLSTEEELYKYLKWQGHVEGEDEIRRQAKERHIFQSIMNKYSEAYEYMTRMVFMSRKAGELINYDNSLVVGEDTVQYFKLKKLAFEGKLRVFKKKDGQGEIPTYVQVRDEDGITKPLVCDWSWVTPLNRKLEQMEKDGELFRPNVNVPDINFLLDNN